MGLDFAFQEAAIGGRVRLLVVADDAPAAAAGLADVLGGSESVMVADPNSLSAGWPDYVAARARTGGALVVEAGAVTDRAAFTHIAEGRLFGRRAVVGVVSGTLVFALQEAEDLAAAA